MRINMVYVSVLLGLLKYFGVLSISWLVVFLPVIVMYALLAFMFVFYAIVVVLVATNVVKLKAVAK